MKKRSVSPCNREGALVNLPANGRREDTLRSPLERTVVNDNEVDDDVSLPDLTQDQLPELNLIK